MTPPETRVVVHDKPSNRTSWVHHGTLGWYIGPSLDHYRYIQCYILSTGIVRITDTLQYIPKACTFPNTNTENYLKQEIGDIIEIIKDPLRIPLFLYYDVATKNAIDNTDHILQISTDQPRLHILQLPPMLLQSHNKKCYHKNHHPISISS